MRTPPDVLSWARQGGEPNTVQRDTLAEIAPALIGVGGLILLIAFATRAISARRLPLVALPVVFRALRTDAGIVVLGACAFMLLHLVQTTTADGTLLFEDLNNPDYRAWARRQEQEELRRRIQAVLDAE